MIEHDHRIAKPRIAMMLGFKRFKRAAVSYCTAFAKAVFFGASASPCCDGAVRPWLGSAA
jgi:hypothetical protein